MDFLLFPPPNALIGPTCRDSLSGAPASTQAWALVLTLLLTLVGH